MEKSRILVVAPYAGMKELILSMSKQYEQFSFDVLEANLEEALPRLRQVDLNTYFAILSRGGTAKLISQNTDQFVVDIGISGFDILRLVMLAKNYPGKAVIIGFDSITRHCRAICELLQMDVDIYTIDGEEQAAATLNTLDKTDSTMVLGDVISTRIAGRMGFTNLLISSGVESLQGALEEIERQTRFVGNCRRRNDIYRSIQARAPDTVYVFDQEARPVPEWDDGSRLCAVLTKYAGKVFDGEEQTFLLKTDDGRHYCVTGRLLKNESLGSLVFAAFYVREMESIAENAAVTLLGQNDIDKSDFNILIGKNEQLRRTMQLAHKLAPTDTPVLIEGEIGTGKSLLAKMIHTESACRNNLFVQIDCPLLGEGDLAAVLEKDLPEILRSGQVTLFFSGLHRLRLSEQEELTRRLPALSRHRLVFSSERDLFELVRTGRLHSRLLTMLSMNKIWIPPLRSRKENIEECFYHLLTKMNIRHGKQIVGIEKPALELLTSYNWPGNLEQFRQVVSNAVLQERGSYICKGVVASLLSVYNQAQWGRKRYGGQTLQEIEQEIVIATLQDMNMNQSQAAKQLGISRTTLWRLLKNTSDLPVTGAMEARKGKDHGQKKL